MTMMATKQQQQQVNKKCTGSKLTLKPPRPPCWRDFMPDGTLKHSSSSPSMVRLHRQHLTDKSGHVVQCTSASQQRQQHQQVHSSMSPVSQQQLLAPVGLPPQPLHRHVSDREGSVPKSITSVSQSYNGNACTSEATIKQYSLHKKLQKNRLHRTRSQCSIDLSQLPSTTTDILLTEGHIHEHCNDNTATVCYPPRAFNTSTLTKSTTASTNTLNSLEDRKYLVENAIRCELWLETVLASKDKFEDVFTQGSGDELEIPEENWRDLERFQKSSTSSSDVDSVSNARPPRITRRKRTEKFAKRATSAATKPSDVKLSLWKLQTAASSRYDHAVLQSQAVSDDNTHELETVLENTLTIC